MALNTALSGIQAAQSDLNVISNNIANANTTGYKGSRAEFSEVYAVTGLNLNSTAIGSGASLQDVAQQFSQGDIATTNNSLDLAISGGGFFVVNNGSGNTYTRAGNFQTNADNFVVNPAGAELQVYPPTTSGGFNTSTLVPLQLLSVQSQATPTSQVTLSANLPAGATVPTTSPFDPTDATSFNASTPITVYDSQGSTHQATLYYVKTGTNTWDANLAVDGNVVTPPQTITFNSNGSVATPSSGNLTFPTVTLTNGASPLALTVNISNTTQFGTAYSTGAINQNGYAAGTFTSIDIDSNGVVTANYSNNQSAQVGQLALANFANVQGLNQLGDTNWAASGDSGAAVMGTAGVGQFGTVQAGALESSNTSDTTAQLVAMIQAQQDYQANAQVLSTNSTLTSALLNAVSAR